MTLLRAVPSTESPEGRLLCRVLRGEPAAWPDADGDDLAARLLAACEREGLAPLLHHCLHATPHWVQWPEPVRSRLTAQARIAAAVDAVREGELVAVLTALAEARVAALLLKGAALAYTHYPQPALRSRSDVDILIAPADRAAATAALQALGYLRVSAVSGSLVSYQDILRRQTGQVGHVVDLHWQVNNGQVFAQALTLDELCVRAVPVPVPGLGAVARTLDPPHALLLACMHRAGHLGVDGPEGERLIWLYDIHLLAEALTPGEWDAFAADCAAKRMRAVCADALAAARQAFGTALPADVVDRIAPPAAPEPSAQYLAVERGGVFRIDFAALPRWRDRARLLKEHVFPPADYMLEKYGARGRWTLPWLYLRRTAGGLRKLPRRRS